MDQKFWTVEEDARLLELYVHHTAKEVSDMMGRTLGAVKNRLLKLNPKTENHNRECLRCEGKFVSSGPMNRLCGTCRNRSLTSFTRIVQVSF